MQLSSEDFEQHVIDTLVATLPAALVATAAQYLAKDQAQGLAEPDGSSWVELPAPDSTGYAPGGVDARTTWPTIEVAVPDLELDNFSLGQQDADAAVTLVVCVWLKDPRFPVLERASKRYSAAVHACLTVPNALGDATIERVRFAWRTNPELRDTDERIEAGGLIVYTLSSGQVRT